MQVDIRELQERVERESSFVDALTLGMNQVIVGKLIFVNCKSAWSARVRL